MSHAIYGLRLIGDTEVRYVGLTGGAPQGRLERLTCEARMRQRGWRLRDPDGFQCWLLDNEGRIEAITIHRVASKPEGHAAERAVVAALLAAEHRLFNSWLVPQARRINAGGFAIGSPPSLTHRRAAVPASALFGRT